MIEKTIIFIRRDFVEEKEKSVICWPLIGLLLLLCFISCLGIKSATPLITKGNPSGYWIKQLMFYGISFIIWNNRTDCNRNISVYFPKSNEE